MKRRKKPRYWAYKNTLLLVLSVAGLFLVVGTAEAQELIASVGELGYVGALLTGIFFVSTFTVAPASVVLFHLAHTLDPVWLALWGGLGSTIGDLVLFRFLRDGVYQELAPLIERLRRSHMFALFRTPYFMWLAPFLGVVIIASPLPDEVGIGLLGLSKIRVWQFTFLVFMLNALGILTIACIARAL